MKTLELKNMRGYPKSRMTRKKIDETTRTITFTFASEALALDDGILLLDGGKFDRYLANPSVFADHDTRLEAKVGVVTGIRRVGQTLEGDFKFAPPEVSQRADDVYKMLAWAETGATSIGFIVHKRRSPTPEECARWNVPNTVWVGQEWTLLEISIVGIGADPEAVMRKGGPYARAVRAFWADVGLKKAKETIMGTSTQGRDGVVISTDPAMDTGTEGAESPAMEMSYGEFPQIGDRVRPIGMGHDPLHKTGVVAALPDQYAVGVIWDGTDVIHQWYIPSELAPETVEQAAMMAKAGRISAKREVPPTDPNAQPNSSAAADAMAKIDALIAGQKALDDKLSQILAQLGQKANAAPAADPNAPTTGAKSMTTEEERMWAETFGQLDKMLTAPTK